MIRSRRAKLLALVAAGSILAAACGDNKKSTTSSSAAPTTAPATTAASSTSAAGTTAPATSAAGTTAAPTTAAPATTAAPTGWKAPVDQCADQAAATKPITGTVKIGAVMPLTGGPAVAFAPVAEGMKAYIKYADDNNLVPGYKLELTIEDDQYNKDLTPGAVEKLLKQSNVDFISGIIGTPSNLAVRDTLNESCVPQLNALTGSPAWGDVKDYPWTTGALVPYNVESKVYASQIKKLYPNGAKVALFSVNNEFGKVYVDAFKELASANNLDIVDEQTIEETDSNPPTSQLTSIASKKPDVIVAAPLGLQCPTFLKELANIKAANAGWDPKVFETNTCASKLFVSTLAGDAGKGVITSSNGVDVADPKNAGNPGVKTFLDAYHAAGLDKLDPGTTAAGWGVGEVTVAIIKKALESGTLSRASIIEAARTMTYTTTLARPGVQYKMNGDDDAYPFESLQVIQWNGTTFDDVGATITEFEGTTKYSG